MNPIRTALFAPGIRENVMTKALASGVDAVILDLEDSVPLASKAEARGLVAKVVNAVGASEAAHPVIMVRVNAFNTGLLAADLAAMVQVSIAAYAVAGLFLNLATFDLYYHLIAIVVITQSLVRHALVADASADAAARLSPFERPSGARA